MKIAICSTGDKKESIVAKRFARCEYFMIYDHETLKSSFVENKARNEASGAGGKASKNLADLEVNVVLVPQLGPKAYDALKAFDIDAYEYNHNVSAHKALYDYFAKEYNEVTDAKGKGKH